MRSASLADYLACLAPALPSGLFPRHSLDAMREAVAGIPWPLLSLFGFERPLDDDDAAADILFAANVATGGRDILNGLHPLVSYAVPWPPIARFCSRWNEVSSPLYRGADDVWFEFDTGSAEKGSAEKGSSPPPSFFFGPRIGLDPGVDPAARTRAILHEGFEALLGSPLATDTAACLDRTLAILPRHARIFQTGLMLSRPSRQIRICVDNLSAPEIAGLVAATRGGAAGEHLAAALGQIGQDVLSLKLALDLGAEVGPRIGVECYAAIPQRHAAPQAWSGLLATLVALGVCRASLRDALMALPPLVSAADLPAPWPEEDSLAALVSRELALEVKLHHVKLTVEEERPTRAKAYIAVERVWLA
jgi:hypothetical protein